MRRPEHEATAHALSARPGARHGGEALDCVSAPAGAWITRDIIRTAGTVFDGRFDPAASGPCFIGVDVARRRGLWVAVVLREVTGVLWLRAITTLRDAPFSGQRVECVHLTSARRLDVAPI